MLTFSFASRHLLSLAITTTLFSLCACGTMPVPLSDPEEPVQTVEKEYDAVEFASVSASPELVDDVPSNKPTVEEPVDRPFFTKASDYWREAVRDLQTGRVEDARWALGEALAINPKHRRSLALLEQLDVDPVETLGTNHFEYKIQSGDSLSKLAQQHLDDPMKFFLLARYNSIENPNSIKAGQVIRIPGQGSDSSIDTAAISDTNVIKAKSLYETGAFEESIDLLEGSGSEIGATETELKAANEVLVASYLAQSKRMTLAKNYLTAEQLLKKALAIEPGNATVKDEVARLQSVMQAEQFYKQGLAALEINNKDEAYLAFDQAVRLNSAHIDAREKRDEIQAGIAEELYRNALQAQRQRKLTEAIALWDQFLIIQPGNDIAKLHRARAMELKMNLQSFVAKD